MRKIKYLILGVKIMAYHYNYKMANLGKSFEELVNYQNQLYINRGVSTVQFIPTPWVVTRRYGKIVDAHTVSKSTLDYRGSVKINNHNFAVSFDAKETSNEQGLPLRNILEHQVDFIRNCIKVGEYAFVLCSVIPNNQVYLIPGDVVVEKYDSWKANKGKHGYNLISVDCMESIPQTRGNVCDWLELLNRKVIGYESNE